MPADTVARIEIARDYGVRHSTRDWRGWKFMAPFAATFVFVFIVPIVYALFISLFQTKMVGGNQFVGFDNYVKLFGDVQFWSALKRVAMFTVVQVPIMLAISAFLALALDSMRLHGVKFIRVAVFLPYAIPAVVSTLMWGFIYGVKYGLFKQLNQALGTMIEPLSQSGILIAIGNIVTWEFIGYNMLIFFSALTTIPKTLYEAATIDGATELQIVRRIKLPELKGSLAITVIFSIIGSFQLFNEPNILSTMVPGNVIPTYFTPNMYAYNLAFAGSQTNYASAMAIVMALITMTIAYAVQLRSMKDQMK